MTAVLQLDNLDLYPYLRVAKDDGLDPSGGDFRAPLFGDTAGEGAPLISFSEGNREIVIPVHLKGDGSANGVHEIVQTINIACSKAKTLKWQDEGASDISHLDVLAARFEPDYHFRRVGRGWMTGTIRVWTKPYAHTGTSILAGTAAATAPVIVSLPSYACDAPVIVDVLHKAGSSLPLEGRVIVAAAVPSGYKPWWPAASLSIVDTTFQLVGASGAVGSQYIGRWSGVGAEGKTVARLHLSPATQYVGRNRVFGLARGHSRVTKLIAVGPEGDLNLHGSTPSAARHHTFVDLGVLSVPSSIKSATLTLSVRAASGINQDLRSDDSITGGVQLSGLLIVPDDKLMLTVDHNRRLLGQIESVDAHTGYVGSTVPVAYDRVVDSVGNGYASHGFVTGGLAWTRPLLRDGYWMFVGGTAAAQGFVQAGLRIDHPTTADLQIDVEAGGTTHRATSAIIVGKYGGAANIYTKATFYALSSGALSLHADSTLLASIAVQNAHQIVRFQNQGPVVNAAVFSAAGSLVASISASRAAAIAGGQAIMGVVGSISDYALLAQTGAIESYRIAEVPSRPLAAQDLIHLAADDTVTRSTVASVVTGDLTGRTFGKAPRIPPGIPHNVVAYSMPIEGGSGADWQAVEVRVRERFTYHR